MTENTNKKELEINEVELNETELAEVNGGFGIGGAAILVGCGVSFLYGVYKGFKC